MSDRFPITPEGYERLQEELHNLKTVERPAIIAAIEEARAHGDLSENAEYHAAKEKQGFIEAKIQDLEAKKGLSEVIKVSELSGDQVKFGATVKLVDEDTEKEFTYKIVSDFEADADKGHISSTSPVARAMMGKNVGDSIEVHTPSGEKFYEILKVEFK